jgi:hypothetical protein
MFLLTIPRPSFENDDDATAEAADTPAEEPAAVAEEPAEPEPTPVPVEHESGPAPEDFVPRKPKPVMGVGFGNVLKDVKPRKTEESQ